MKKYAANKSRILNESKFTGYTHCLNPYIGCGHKCLYCHARFFIKHKGLEWGEFLRYRKHIPEKLPKELKKIRFNESTIKVVMGTMTDPYQQAENEFKLTEKSLKILYKYRDVVDKLGIFTKSTLIEKDLDLINSFDNPNIHMTISPIAENVREILENTESSSADRFKLLKSITDNKDFSNIKIHLNLAPMFPGFTSEEIIEKWCQIISKLNITSIFVDPFMKYKSAVDMLDLKLRNNDTWNNQARPTIMFEYKDWKVDIREVWKKYFST
ncbi:MAG: radical SAM protein, partial [Petrotogales bacterium]